MHIFFLVKGSLAPFLKYIENTESNHHSCLLAEFLLSNIFPILKYFLSTLVKQLI